MADNSSSSTSSDSSSSSGVQQSKHALLEATESAILAVLNNQSYNLFGRQVTRADYAELVKERRKLLKEVGQNSGLSPRISHADMSAF